MKSHSSHSSASSSSISSSSSTSFNSTTDTEGFNSVATVAQYEALSQPLLSGESSSEEFSLDGTSDTAPPTSPKEHKASSADNPSGPKKSAETTETKRLNEHEKLTVDDIITKPNFKKDKDKNRQDYLLAQFNGGIVTNHGNSAVTYTNFPGRNKERIQPGKFLIVARNQVAELVPPSPPGQQVALAITGIGQKTERIKLVDQNEVYYGAYGKHIVNVPSGCYAKVIHDNEYKLLDEGPHVFHDGNFVIAPEAKDIVVNKSERYIQFGNLHILTVPDGKLAKIWIGSNAILLDSRPEPYYFNTPLFKFEPAETLSNGTVKRLFADVSENLIIHGNIKRINPAPNEVPLFHIIASMKS